MVTRLRSAWPAAVLVALLAGWTLTRFGVGARDVLAYGGWLLAGVTLPGTLLWRALRGPARSFVEDVAAGTAVGFATVIGVYIGLRAIGAPALVVAWPVPVVAAFVLVRPLRAHWRPAYPDRAPAWFGWLLAGLGALVLGWLTVVYYRTHPLSGPAAAFPYVDLPFQLAMAAEVTNHVPPERPYLLGEPLNYHWFPAADLAASHWATRIDLRILLLRLEPLPYMAVTMTLTAVTAARLSGRWWAGAVAAGIAFFGAPLAPYRWSPGTALVDGRLQELYHVLSPTQLVAFALFAPVPLLLLDQFRGDGPRRAWVLIGGLLAVVAGSKPTYLPLLLAGVAVAAVASLVVRRRVPAPLLVTGLIGGTLFGVTAVTLYAGGSYGMRLAPLFTVDGIPATLRTGLDAPLVLAGLVLAGLLVPAAGALGLVRGPDRLFGVLLGGMVAAAIAVLLLFKHPGGSQFYFLYSAYPLAAVLVAAGVARLAPARAYWLLPAGLAGAGLAVAVTGLGPAAPPSTVGGLVAPPALVAAVLALAAVAAVVVPRVRSGVRDPAAALAMVCAAALGTGLAGTAYDYRGMVSVVADFGYRPHPLPSDGRPIGDDALAAARWLRDNSAPDDLVATNDHCRQIIRNLCDNRHFWVAAYTERRVLVESWGYTARAVNGPGNQRYAPFDDTELLAANDAAFQRPTESSVDELRRRGVRWLLVDERYRPPSPALTRYATLRHRTGAFAVYSLR